jgi:transposase
MRTVNYKELIKEDIKELASMERKEVRGRIRDRIRLLRLLRSDQCSTLKGACKILGFTYQTGKNMWNIYKTQGISGITQWGYSGRKARVSYDELMGALDWETDGPMNLRQAGVMIRQRFGVNYSSSGVRYLFNTYKIKLKTGRPRNYKKEEGKEEEFKKNFKK